MRFPYGIADFRKIREEGYFYFYVDRTDRIPLIEEVGSQLLAVPAPAPVWQKPVVVHAGERFRPTV